MKYRLGLDVGTNSLGWSMVEINQDNEAIKIIDAGSRIFTEGREHKTKATLAASRRDKRSARRRRDRYKQRRTYLLDELSKIGLFPADKDTRLALQKINPIEMRARLLSEAAADILADLKTQKDAVGEAARHQNMQPAYLIGRALFHLNQRRGFKSNRKDKSEEAKTGKVSNSVRLLLENMELIDPPMEAEVYKALSTEEKKQQRKLEVLARQAALDKLASQDDLTYGKFLYDRQCAAMPTRARPSEETKLYDIYPSRELYLDEYNKIWARQRQYFPQLMAEKETIEKVIFAQRPLKPQERGRCAYMKQHLRTFRAMPSFQRYRVYQEVNNLEWSTAQGRQSLTDYPEARDAIIALHETVTTKSGMVVWSKMKNILKKMDIAEGNFEFNFETPKRTGFHGNLTSNIMQGEDFVGDQWHDWDLAKQDSFIDIILDDELDDEEVVGHLVSQYGIDQAAATKCMSAALVEGTASVSREAASLMLAKMRDGMQTETDLILPIQSDAAQMVAEERDDFVNPMRQPKTDGDFIAEPSLPFYGEWFQEGSHIIPGKRREEDRDDPRKFFGSVTNPTVHIALNQIRQVVNELIERHGHPHSIAIELGRELPVGQDGRREITEQQKLAQDENERFDAILREQGQTPHRDNRLRLRLWEELGKNPADRRCPFSGDVIGMADLFSDHVEIEHLIPFSLSLDDSRANKVLSTREANQRKGQRTPYEAFGDGSSEYSWDDIFARIQTLPKSKQWRFEEDALEQFKQQDDFTARHLNDTRYIGRLAREYLEAICPIDNIDVLTGRLTSLLRGHWGLNSVLWGDNLPDTAQKKKNRDDHRHHAVDAIVIAMTNKSILQKVATAANRAEALELKRLFPKNADGHSQIDPWDGFRDDVKKVVRRIIVSHKARKKKLRPGVTTSGQLHNDTALGLIAIIDEKKGKWQTVTRRPITHFETQDRLSDIRDEGWRVAFQQAFYEAVSDGKKGIEGVKNLAAKHGVRHIRCYGRESAIPIRDKHGNIYKGYKGDSNWGIEIYGFPDGHKKSAQWQGVVISTYDANQAGFQPGTSFRPEPSAYLVMRLQINDCVEVIQDGKAIIWRLQLVSQSGNMSFAPLEEANVDRRNRDKGDDFNYQNKNANPLRQLQARKVHISPTGRVNYEARRKRRKKG